MAKVVIKGTNWTGIITGLLLLAILIYSQVPSAFGKDYYQLGEKIKLDIGDIGEYTLSVRTPDKTYVKKTSSPSFVMVGNGAGEYEVKIENDEYEKTFSFEVLPLEAANPLIEEVIDIQEKETVPLTGQVTKQEEQKEEITNNNTQEENEEYIEVGKPVKWNKDIQTEKGKLSIKIPEAAYDIGVQGNTEFKVKTSVLDTVGNLFRDENQKSLVLNSQDENVRIEYSTPGPEQIEKKLTGAKKEILITSEVHYENIKAKTQIPERTSVKEDISVYWEEENTYLDFKPIDTDGDSVYDEIEWIVPHLSDQTFKIIIDIVDADHLDENRVFIEKIYDELDDLDNVWVSIPNQHYVRVTFEQELNFWNDITVYAKGQGSIEIYEYEGTTLLETIEIDGIGEYKKFLTELEEPQDTFDLRIIGDIELDYVIDPSTLGFCTGIIVCSDNGGSGSCACSQIGTSDNTYLSGGLSSKSQNLAQALVNLSNTSLVPVGSQITDAELIIEFGVDGGLSYCIIDYTTNWSVWTPLNPDCTGNTTEGTNYYDLSSLTEAQLENITLNFTSWKTSGSGPPIDLDVDYVALNITYTILGDYSVILNDPVNGEFINSLNVSFNYTPSTDSTFINCSLWDNSTGTLNYNLTNQTTITNGTYNYNLNKTYLNDGQYEWTTQCCDTVTGCFLATTNETFTIDTVAPVVTLLTPVENYNSSSNFGVGFTFNVTDTHNILNCSVYIDGALQTTDYSITKDINQTINSFVPNGVHNWTIGCYDEANNFHTQTNRTINVTLGFIDWQPRFYETFTTNFSLTEADIYLNYTRDSVDNEVTQQLTQDETVTLVDAYSPYVGGSGAFLENGTVSFSGVFSTSQQNQEYITWKAYISNNTGDFLICQSGDDGTGGTQLTSAASTTYTSSCTPESGNLTLGPDERIRLVINGFNNHNNDQTITHIWDNLRLSYVEFNDFYSIGTLSTNLTFPTTPQFIVTGNNVTATCNVDCSQGTCGNTQVYLQYNTSAAAWTNISSSGNLILAAGQTNPVSLGTLNQTSTTTNFTITGNTASINNIRCVATSIHTETTSPRTEQITVTAANQAPTVELFFPNSSYWLSTTNFDVSYNVSDDNNFLASCDLYINGLYNQTNSSTIINNQYNNFTFAAGDGQYNWNVTCNDTAGLLGWDNDTFYIDTQLPQFQLHYPGINEVLTQSLTNFNFTVTDNLDSDLSCNLTVDGTVIDPGFTTTNASYTIRPNSLGLGDHLWNVTCWDEANNINTSETRNFTIQDFLPNVTLLTENLTWFNTLTPTLFYNASDNNAIANCSLYINGIYDQSNTTIINETGPNNFTYTAPTNEAYDWTVTCTDDAGSPTTPTNRTFYIDTLFPQINLSLPADLSTFYDADLDFNFTTTDNLGLIYCNLTLQNNIIDSNFSATNATLTNRNYVDLPDGEQYWNVTCWDQALNTNTSATRLVNISEYPTVFQNISEGYSFDTSTILLNYTVSDNVGLSSCSLYLNGAFNQTNQTPIINGALNNFSLNLGAGNYNWSISCNDTVGIADPIRLTTTTGYRNFTVDLAQPTIRLNEPLSDIILYTSTVNFNYTAIDDLDTLLLCNLTVNNQVLNTTNATNASYTIIPESFSTGGLKYWNVTCQDDAGNINTSKTWNFTLFLPPEVTLVYPDPNIWLNTINVSFLYEVNDSNNDILNSTLILNGITNESNQTPIINEAENAINVTGIPEGQYNWTINVLDAEGLIGNDTERTFWIDRTPPSIFNITPTFLQTLTTNNITANFSTYDNLDFDNITCNITIGLPGDLATVSNIGVENNTYHTEYILRADGNYTWFANCTDNALNTASTPIINFSIIAPPIVTLNFPGDDYRTNETTINFNYTPEDAIGITQCTLYVNSIINGTDNTIDPNEPNFFNGRVLSEGEHNWTVSCIDADSNVAQPTENIFYIDQTGPNIQLHTPENNSLQDANSDVLFNWTATDYLDSLLQCDLRVDGNIEANDVFVTNATPYATAVSGLGAGTHQWNVTCWDQVGNTNTSTLGWFNYTYPDFMVNSTSISVNNSNPTENETIEINATIWEIGGVDTTGINVTFYNEDPDSGGTIIDSRIINIAGQNSNTTSINWNAELGTTTIYIRVDPPLATNGSFQEANESNNEANHTIIVSSWHFFYGDLTAESEFNLEDSTEYKIVVWGRDNATNSNIYVADYDSTVDWSSLQAIGRNIPGTTTLNDTEEIDALLGSTNFVDSVNATYVNATGFKETNNYTLFGEQINYVPVAISINDTDFKTGILWDTSDDQAADLEYDLNDSEDIIFLTKVNYNTPGTYDTVDYEMRVPALLRNYSTADQRAAAFYIELY